MRHQFWKGIAELSCVMEHLERTLLKCKVENWELITVKRDSWVASRCPSLNAVLSTDAKCVQLKKKKGCKNNSDYLGPQILANFKVTFIHKSLTCNER